MPMLMINRIAADNRLKPLSFSADSGEIVHFIGPNGSGKSTAIGLISGSGGHFDNVIDKQFLGRFSPQ